MNRWNLIMSTSIVAVALAMAVALAASPDKDDTDGSAVQSTPAQAKGFGQALKQIREGRDIFRYQAFGDEAFWSEKLRLHEAIAGAENGGTGPGVSPLTAQSVGLKVNVEALPRTLQLDLGNGLVDLNDPATMLALLQLDAVVGVRGFFDDVGQQPFAALSCAPASQHSTRGD